jgi:hypothetical protein
MQTVWICAACEWRGVRLVMEHRRRRWERPEACGRCGATELTSEMQKHPKVHCGCACGEEFLGTLYQTRCRKCRFREASAAQWKVRRRKYDWTPERDQLLRDRYDSLVNGRVLQIARALGWPAWVIKKRAAALGIVTKVLHRHEWTPEQIAFLEEWTGSRSSKWIARRLGLNETCVINKQKRLGFSRRVQGDGYTVHELELCLGMDHRYINRWIREGKLKAKLRGTDRPHDAYVINDADVLAFLRAHQLDYNLRRVDQAWFLGLVFGELRALRETA